jgi:hypothetical protein
MSEDIIERIKKNVNASGHPVSLKVSTILQRNKWYVKNASRYPINETVDEFREVDVFASKESKLYSDSIDNLIIECKKQSDPWVFFRQDRKIDDILTLTTNRFDDESLSQLYNSIEKEGIFKKHHYYDKHFCTFYFVAFKKLDDSKKRGEGGPGNTIDKAINQVYRALLFYIKQGYSVDCTIFFYPIIVFDGELFEAFYDDDELQIQESNHVCLNFEIEYDEPEFVWAPNGHIPRISESKSYIIDVVKLNYFEEFLKNFNYTSKD